MEAVPTFEESAAPATNDGLHLRGWALASVLIGLMLTLLLSALDQTIVGTALPKILQDLGGLNQLAWVVTAYLVASTTVILVVSKLSDQFGRKWLLIGGVIVFLAGSALSGASETMTQLIAFRALQGIGGGALATLVFTLVGDIFLPADRARWQGLFSGVFGLASVVGPVLGGWITDNSTWRWIFYVNLPLGVIALALILFFLPSNISVRSRSTGRNVWARIDWWGATTSAAATVLLLLGLTWGGATYPWQSWQVIGSLSASGVLFIAFIFAEIYAREPILPLDLFKNQVFAAGAALSLTVGLALFAVVIYLPVFLQGVLGVKATNSGLVITPLVVTLAIAAALVGFLVARIGRYQVISIIGALVIVGGFYLLSTMTVATNQTTVVYYMIVLGVGLGMLQPVMTLAVQNAIPLARLGAGTGAVTYLRTLGSALGAALVGAIVTNVSESNLEPRLAKISNSAKLMDGLRSATGTLTNSQALQPLLTTPSLRDQVRTGAIHGANTAPQTQAAIQQAVTAAQNSPQTQAAIQQAVAQATANIPANAPNRQQTVDAITQQITATIDKTIATELPVKIHQSITATVNSTYSQILDAGKHALAAGIAEAFLVAVGIGALIVLITFFLKDVPLRGGSRVSLAEGAEAAFSAEADGIGESEVPALAAIPAPATPAWSSAPTGGGFAPGGDAGLVFGVDGSPGA